MKKTSRSKGIPKGKAHRVRHFGGRATAGGVNYETRVAAYIATHVLCGDRGVLWQGITGRDITAVTLQVAETVDDIVLGLRFGRNARAFVSAKNRAKSVPLTNKSAAFTETVEAFVIQFCKLSPEDRAVSRLVWTVPSTVGKPAVSYLARALDAHRTEASDASFTAFINNRNKDHKKAIDALITLAKAAWKKQTKTSAVEHELREFLRLVYVEVHDFGSGNHGERTAEALLRSHVIKDATEGGRAWNVLEHLFGAADELGTTATAASLREALTTAGIKLNAAPDYAADVEQLRNITKRNMARLRQHTTLQFGPNKTDATHLSRRDDLAALSLAVTEGDILLTGDPGCGKSGLIHALVERLEAKGFPVVLLLAEEIFAPGQKQENTLPGLLHPLDEILANWPTGNRGYLVTDALDAVRDPETQRSVRRLLEEVRQGNAHWTVFASVREFDLKNSRELRDAFSGDGFKGHSSPEVAGVAHFFLASLSESDLKHLATRRPQIRPFLASAENNPRSLSLHKSPFYLSLAAELLRNGVTPTRLADWSSPAVLFRKFWDIRVEEGTDSDQREATLTSVCRQMVGDRAMVLSTTQMSLGKAELASIRELKSRGILQSPILRYGTSLQPDLIRFTHHLLHDYAIARAYIPTDSDQFSNFAIREPLLPVFYRQSFMFALEQLWDSDFDRGAFWKAALRLEGVSNLHGLTRILAPVVAARRVEEFHDLEPLLKAIRASSKEDAGAYKALRHLASGLQDAPVASVLAGFRAWSEFTQCLGALLPSTPTVEGPLVHIMARLNSANEIKSK